MRRLVWSDKLPGHRPPAGLVALLRRTHPRVRLVWHCLRRCWAIVEHGRDNRWSEVLFLRRDERPNRKNTLDALNEVDTVRIGGASDVLRWVEQLDATRTDREAEQRGRDRISEGSEKMYHALSGKVMVPVPPKGE